MLRPVSPSSEAVGSSKIRMSGRLTIARAIATRCCSPPLSLTGGSCGAVLQPDDLEVLGRLVDRLVPVAPLQDQRDRDVLGRRQAREQVIVLEHEADLVQPEVGQRVVATGSRCPCPRSSRVPAFGRRMPGDHAEHGGLAAARRADDVEHLAEIGLEGHVLDGVRPGLALAEPFVERRRPRLRRSPWLSPGRCRRARCAAPGARRRSWRSPR